MRKVGGKGEKKNERERRKHRATDGEGIFKKEERGKEDFRFAEVFLGGFNKIFLKRKIISVHGVTRSGSPVVDISV